MGLMGFSEFLIAYIQAFFMLLFFTKMWRKMAKCCLFGQKMIVLRLKFEFFRHFLIIGRSFSTLFLSRSAFVAPE